MRVAGIRAVEEYLRDLGDDAAADELLSSGITGQGIGLFSKAYNKTGLSIGYVAPEAGAVNMVSIVDATGLKANRQAY